MKTKLNTYNKFFDEIECGQVFKEIDGFCAYIKTDTVELGGCKLNAVRLLDGSHHNFLDKCPIICIDGMFVEGYN